MTDDCQAMVFSYNGCSTACLTPALGMKTVLMFIAEAIIAGKALASAQRWDKNGPNEKYTHTMNH